MVQVIHKMRENVKQKSDALLDEKRKVLLILINVAISK